MRGAGVVTITSKTPGTAFTIASAQVTDADGDMTEVVATPTANAGTTGIYKVDISSSSTLSTDVSALLTAIKNNDSNFS